MSYFDGFAPAYTFRLRIEREDRPILDTAITAREDPSEIARAKKDIQRLLNGYTPVIKAPEPAPAQLPVATDRALPEAQGSEETAADQQEEPQAEAAVLQSSGAISRDRPEGARGLLRLRCPECGCTFGTFLREHQKALLCKCGHPIDLTVPLARFRFTCPHCEKESWGRTNSEEPELIVRCVCGGDVDLRWNPKAKEYQN